MSFLRDFHFACQDYPVIYHAVYNDFYDEYIISWVSRNYPEGASERGYSIEDVTGYIADGTWIIIDSLIEVDDTICDMSEVI